MRIIRPITIEFADITSNNLTESASEYNSSFGGVYAVGAEAKVTGTSGGAAVATYHKYKCLKGASGNLANCETTTASFPVGSTLIAMSTSIGSGTITAGDFVQFDNDPNFYEIANTYLGGSHAFIVLKAPGLLQEIPATTGGTAMDQANAEDYDPTLYPEVWEDLGAINSYKPFDLTPSDRATRASSASISFQPDGVVNAIAIVNFIAEVVGVKVVSSGNGTLYDTSSSGSGTEPIDITTDIGDWYDQFFSADEQKINHAIFDFNPNGYDDLTITVEFSVASGDVEIGQIAVGPYADIGKTEQGTTFDVLDYSEVNVNAAGIYNKVDGIALDNHRVSVYNDLEYWPECKKVMREIRKNVVVLVLDGDDGSAMDYAHQGEGILMGFIRDYSARTESGGSFRIDIDVLGLF